MNKVAKIISSFLVMIFLIQSVVAQCITTNTDGLTAEAPTTAFNTFAATLAPLPTAVITTITPGPASAGTTANYVPAGCAENPEYTGQYIDKIWSQQITNFPTLFTTPNQLDNINGVATIVTQDFGGNPQKAQIIYINTATGATIGGFEYTAPGTSTIDNFITLPISGTQVNFVVEHNGGTIDSIVDTNLATGGTETITGYNTNFLDIIGGTPDPSNGFGYIGANTNGGNAAAVKFNTVTGAIANYIEFNLAGPPLSINSIGFNTANGNAILGGTNNGNNNGIAIETNFAVITNSAEITNLGGPSVVPGFSYITNFAGNYFIPYASGLGPGVVVALNTATFLSDGGFIVVGGLEDIANDGSNLYMVGTNGVYAAAAIPAFTITWQFQDPVPTTLNDIVVEAGGNGGLAGKQGNNLYFAIFDPLTGFKDSDDIVDDGITFANPIAGSIGGGEFITMSSGGGNGYVIAFGDGTFVPPVPEFGEIALLLAALVALGGVFVARRNFQ